jgi:hypothetical protein
MPLGGEACNQLAALDLTEIATIRPMQLVAMIAADMPAGVSPQVVSVQMAEIRAAQVQRLVVMFTSSNHYIMKALIMHKSLCAIGVRFVPFAKG